MADDHTITSLGVDEILLTSARGLIRAQQAMDAASLENELRIREAGLDERFGVSATWFSIPELELKLHLAFNISERGEVQTELVDADYQSRYGFSVQASSDLHTKFVAVPPPEGRGISLLDEPEVLRRVGRIKSVVEAWTRADTPRFVVSYRAFANQGYAGGLWQVILVDQLNTGGTTLRAWAVFDDASGDVLRLWTDVEPQLEPPPPEPRPEPPQEEQG